MAELVRDGIDGMHFKVGDSNDLKRCMLKIIDNPSLLQQMRDNLPALPRLSEQAAIVRQKYQQLLALNSSASGKDS
jgi:glycosyltransferase involved in cell wall biosynthesis